MLIRLSFGFHSYRSQNRGNEYPPILATSQGGSLEDSFPFVFLVAVDNAISYFDINTLMIFKRPNPEKPGVGFRQKIRF